MKCSIVVSEGRTRLQLRLPNSWPVQEPLLSLVSTYLSNICLYGTPRMCPSRCTQWHFINVHWPKDEELAFHTLP